MNLIHCKVGPDEIDELQEILTRCGEGLHRRFGARQWYPPPPIELMRRSAVEKDVFAVRDGDGTLVGTFTFGVS
ncbi:MAG: hypothetical protein ACLQVD_06175 [Capsulimonadaceae bacterium]